jgi:hypothetical protein
MAKGKEEKPSLTVKELAAMGGAARAKGMTKARRKEIAKNAAKARWANRSNAATK